MLESADLTGRIALAQHFLAQAPLRNIALRKFLGLYDALDCRLHLDANAAVDGVLAAFATAQFGYDRAAYPAARHMVLLSTRSPIAAQALLADLPNAVQADDTVVFKLLESDFLPMLAQRYAMERQCSFVSFTNNSAAILAPDSSAVHVSASIPPHCLPLLMANNYSLEELQHYFANGNARCYWICAGTEQAPVAACISYENEPQLHEIAALYTAPEARRRGYAQALVQAALAGLARAGKQVRYQVRDDNFASVALAKSLGLAEFATLTHWLGVPR